VREALGGFGTQPRLGQPREILVATDSSPVYPKHHGRAFVVGVEHASPIIWPGVARGLYQPARVGVAAFLGAFRASEHAVAITQKGAQGPIDQTGRPRFAELAYQIDALVDRGVVGHARVEELIESDEKRDAHIELSSGQRAGEEHVDDRLQPREPSHDAEGDLAGERPVAPLTRQPSGESCCVVQ